MSFTWFNARPLHTREEAMGIIIAMARELELADERGACIVAGMTWSQEAGADPYDTGETQLWCPGNHADPCFEADPNAYPFDSMGNDGLSVGPYQQQTSRPGAARPWGWGGQYGDPAGTRRRMDAVESTRLFLQALARTDYAGKIDNSITANRYAQQVQGSGVPDAYAKHWSSVNALYDSVVMQHNPPVVPAKKVDTKVWTGDPTFLPDVLSTALGKRLKVLPGWEASGHGDFKDIRGLMVHHTGNSRESAQSIRNGRPDLEGPLSNLHCAPDGTVTLVAVGVCWHAGVGSYPWLPTNMGNWHLIGMECAWPDIAPNGSYDEHQLWPDAQIISMRDVAAALMLELEFRSDRTIGHKEYAGRAQGKWDPGNIDMGWFREEVDKDMLGLFDGDQLPPPPVPPVVVPVPGGYAHILLFPGTVSAQVAALQTRLKRNYSKLVVDGIYGGRTEACVRDYQRLHPPLDVDGIVGPATAASLQLVI